MYNLFNLSGPSTCVVKLKRVMPSVIIWSDANVIFRSPHLLFVNKRVKRSKHHAIHINRTLNDLSLLKLLFVTFQKCLVSILKIQTLSAVELYPPSIIHIIKLPCPIQIFCRFEALGDLLLLLA